MLNAFTVKIATEESVYLFDSTIMYLTFVILIDNFNF
jgi:hypothetical protein